MRAKKGSGGVGCFVRNSITQIYNVSIIDEIFEGILWLKFCPRTNDKPFYCCICYLPPSDSTRNIDPGEFYDTLLFQIHSYCKDDFFYLCGDFNGRCGDLEDLLPEWTQYRTETLSIILSTRKVNGSVNFSLTPIVV